MSRRPDSSTTKKSAKTPVHLKMDSKDTKASTVEFDGKSFVALESELQLESATCGENAFYTVKENSVVPKVVEFDEKATSPLPQSNSQIDAATAAKFPLCIGSFLSEDEHDKITRYF